MPELPLLRLSGAARDIGEAHGRAAADRIAWNLQVYFRRFAAEAMLPRDEVLGRTTGYWAAAVRLSAEFAAMIEGIADGAHQPLLEVAALNLRYELFYTEFSRIAQAARGTVTTPAGECTAFAVMPGAAADGHLRLGQNWDWFPDVAGLLLHVTRPDGLRVLCFTEAGIAGGKIGLNSAGVGLAVNGLLSTEDDWSRLGRPLHLRTWEVLCSARLEDAVRAATGDDRSCSANFVIGQAGDPGAGSALNLETTPGAVSAEPLEGSVYAHANHFLHADRLGAQQLFDEEQHSTYHRCTRMDHLLQRAASDGPVTRETLKTILRDHDGRPDSICRHPSPALPEGERYQTVASAIMDLHAGTMHVAVGPPCEATYQGYQV